MAPTVPRSTVVEYPRLDHLAARTAIFSEHLLEHPGIRHYLATGKVGPFVLSDALSDRAWHRTGLYRRLYQEMGFEDQLGMMLAPPAGRVSGLSLARDRRGFNARDREVMSLLRPHLRQAQANTEALARAMRPASNDADSTSRVALVETGPDGAAKRGLASAQPMLDQFFRHERRTSRRGLPVALIEWMRQRGKPVFVARRENQRLIVRYFSRRQGADAGGLVLFEERSDPGAALGLQAKGLTRREIEVLLEVEKGLTTGEVAAALFISPRTAKKHLENIYGKLGVRNRTSALYWLRRELGG
jgi:DNA-binding CsgD family transcriptional regulator